MTVIHFDSRDTDELRRERLFSGDIYVYGPTKTTVKFSDFARSLISQAFGELDPETAQYTMKVSEYAKFLCKLKPAFIHHPESKLFLQHILRERGCSSEETYFEVPKMRSSTSDGYLTAGIAYAWHPHRDTWYSAPQCQINWWIPVYDLESTNCMAFHPRYWSNAVPNSSEGYNYYDWNQKYRGQHLIQYIKDDPRPLPRPTGEVDISYDIRVVCPPGGMIVFSGAHLHSSVPNTSGKTRFSVDFRTVNTRDLIRKEGAANIDSRCTGTVLHEFRQIGDLSPLPDDILSLYQDGTEHLGSAVFDDKA